VRTTQGGSQGDALLRTYNIFPLLFTSCMLHGAHLSFARSFDCPLCASLPAAARMQIIAVGCSALCCRPSCCSTRRSFEYIQQRLTQPYSFAAGAVWCIEMQAADVRALHWPNVGEPRGSGHSKASWVGPFLVAATLCRSSRRCDGYQCS